MKARALISSMVVVFFLFLMAAPGLNSAEKRVSKFDPMTFLKKPITFITSFLPIFGFSFDSGTATKTTPHNSAGKVKPTTDMTASRPSGGD